jgi:hypothetical protein
MPASPPQWLPKLRPTRLSLPKQCQLLVFEGKFCAKFWNSRVVKIRTDRRLEAQFGKFVDLSKIFGLQFRRILFLDSRRGRQQLCFACAPFGLVTYFGCRMQHQGSRMAKTEKNHDHPVEGFKRENLGQISHRIFMKRQGNRLGMGKVDRLSHACGFMQGQAIFDGKSRRKRSLSDNWPCPYGYPLRDQEGRSKAIFVRICGLVSFGC